MGLRASAYLPEFCPNDFVSGYVGHIVTKLRYNPAV